MLKIQNKTLLVTGAGSGIGKEIVKSLLLSNNKNNNIVYALDNQQRLLDELEQDLLMHYENGTLKTICVDLLDWDSTRDLLEATLPPVVHGVVNNAGVGGEGRLLGGNHGFELLEGIDRIIKINTRSIVNITQIVAKRWIKYIEVEKQCQDNKVDKFCSIVNISSLASIFPTRISLGYNLSKAAVDNLTKSIALELGPHNIRINTINPIIVLGTNISNAWVGAAGEQLKEKLLARIPIKRLAEVNDVVNAVLFLLCDESVRMVHGGSLVVDGGFSVA